MVSRGMRTSRHSSTRVALTPGRRPERPVIDGSSVRPRALPTIGFIKACYGTRTPSLPSGTIHDPDSLRVVNTELFQGDVVRLEFAPGQQQFAWRHIVAHREFCIGVCVPALRLCAHQKFNQLAGAFRLGGRPSNGGTADIHVRTLAFLIRPEQAYGLRLLALGGNR